MSYAHSKSGLFRTHRRACSAFSQPRRSRRGAGAATLHRFASGPSSSTSEGAVGYNNTSGSALQGTVSTSGGNSTIKIPFGVLGEYQASTSTFGIGIAGISTSGYAVGAEAFGANPAILAENAGSGDGEDIVVGSGAGDGLAITSSSGGGNGLHIIATNTSFGADPAYIDATDPSNTGNGLLVEAGVVSQKAARFLVTAAAMPSVLRISRPTHTDSSLCHQVRVLSQAADTTRRRPIRMS